MKILLINNFHYRKGGSEAVYFNMARMLMQQGHEVVFFSCTSPQNEQSGSNRHFVAPNNSLPLTQGAMRYIYNREAQRSLERLIQEEQPDIAHIHLFWGGLSTSILDTLRRHKIPVVHTAHDYRMVCPAYTFRRADGTICEECKGGKYYRCLKYRCSRNSLVHSLLMSIEMYLRNHWHKALKKIDGIVFVSKFAHDKHIEFTPQLAQTKSIVSYNTIPEIEERFVSRGRGEYYLFFGRLSYEKGIKTLIEAFTELNGPKLKIVGTGPEEETLRAYVAEHHAEHKIEFVGYRKGDELKELIRDASFVVVPSEWYENNPMTIIEAYSAGIPVIGAQIGGIPEIIDEDRTGYLFPSGGVQELKEAIIKAESLSEEGYTEMSRA
ncbi:MAG: glycosyltransferase, partial [Alistipes sp.]|nr:glycosyltransferase [Alistipes sp.]